VHAPLDPSAPRWLANPGADAAEFSRAVVSAFGQTRLGRSPEAAADVLRNTAIKLRGQMASAEDPITDTDVATRTQSQRRLNDVAPGRSRNCTL
jgi:hypothetical protein